MAASRSNPRQSSPWRGRAGRDVLLWASIGLALVGLQVVLLGLSPKFHRAVHLADQPIAWVVTLGLLGGALLLLVPWTRANRESTGPGLLLWIVVVGVAMRALTMASAPILEGDFERYFWDGAVTAHGLNPYLNIPLELIENKQTTLPHPDAYEALATARGSSLARVGHPQFGTVYPPVAQAFFARAHWIEPWSLAA